MPPVDEQQRAVGLVYIVEDEGHCSIDAFGDVQIEGRDEEANTGVTGETGGQRSLCPRCRVEARKVPSLSFTEQAAFVQQTTSLVRVANVLLSLIDPCEDYRDPGSSPCITAELALNLPSRDVAACELESRDASRRFL